MSRVETENGLISRESQFEVAAVVLVSAAGS